MIDVFETLTSAVSGQFSLAVAASFAWGILSIVLSPCHLTSVPLVMGYISKQNDASGIRSALLALTFASGLLITIALIGLITSSMGRLMGDVGVWSIWLTAGILILFGLYLMDLISLDWLGGALPQIERAGYGGALLLGLVFGVGLGPCTFAFLAPVLTVIIPLAQESMVKALVLILAFGVGHSLVFVVGGGLTGWTQSYITWTRNKRGPIYMKRGLGSLMILGGAYFAYTAL
jgi:cytochrome c-type biogenesis protein